MDVQTLVGLLRGINVGGKTKVPMAELRAMFESLGYEDVRTYVQSGNVVFRSVFASEPDVKQTIEAAIERAFGLPVPVIVRTPRELEAVIERNPFLADESEPTKLHVIFLDDTPDEAAVATLDPNRSPPDRFTVIGRELYVHYPNGAGRSKITIDYVERRLATRATARNWNTVTKLLGMMG
jgi:uncharacterized protein (DUF1697 family)